MNPPKKSRLLSSFDLLLVIIIIISIIICYAGLNMIYNIEEVDDAWTLSFIYNAFVRHIPPESTFGGGLANLKFFGLTQAYIYSFILNILGWTKSNSHLVSMFFMMLSAITWYGILCKLKFSKKLAIFFSLLILWCEPFFREVVLARPESLTFFLISAGFFLFISGRYFFSGLIAMIALENHPMGIMFFVYIAAFIIVNWNTFWGRRYLIKIIMFFISGVIIGSIYYFLLHYKNIGGITGNIREGAGGFLNTVLYQYFFIVAKYKRHLADFIFFIISLGIFIWRGYYKQNRFILIFLLIILAANFLNPRTNFHYTLYFYPAFILLSLFTFEKTAEVEWAVSILFLMFLAYNATIFYRRYYYNFDNYISEIRKAVPDDRLPVVGGPNEWYAFKDREFYAGVYTFSFNTNSREFYLIEGNLFRNGFPGIKTAEMFKDYISNNYSGKLIKSLEINREKYDIQLMSKINP